MMITCPHCKQSIEVADALTHQVQEELLRKEQEKHERELEEIKKKLKVAENTELELRKEKNKLDEEKRTFELEKQRQLDAEREKIRMKAKEEDSEKHRLELKEKETQLESMRKTIEELQRKGSVGSQQLQGEVQELDLEQLLHSTFPQDVIEPIGKGVLGADIRHIVKSPMGMDCGTILWESKRTKAWSDGWIAKLKEDLLHDKAHIPAIISDTLPDEAKSGMGFKDGVWIASHKLALPLAALLRKSLLDAAKQKKIAGAQTTKAEELYGFVTSHDFQHQMEAMIETYQEMQREIQKERSSFERTWKLREMQINRLLTGVSGLYGSMQGIAGAALAPIKNLELPDGD